MRATIFGARVSLATVFVVSACAGAQMNRPGEGDEIGNVDSEDTGNDDDDPSASDDDTTTNDPSTTDPTSPTGATDPVDEETSDPTDTDPTDTDPTDTDPTDDPTDDESSGEASSGTDPSDTDPTDDESSSEGSSSDDGAATDTDAPSEVDLSGWVIVQTASDRELVIPDGTLVPAGGFLVVGRNASSATFQAFWGVAWADEVVYVEGLDSFPSINGAETYTLRDPNNAVVDGPTPALELSSSSARVDAAMSGSEEAAWESSLAPNADAVPGASDASGGVSGVPYISEYADTTGAGNFAYEFVEIHVPL
jgi:hypothetical protein